MDQTGEQERAVVDAAPAVSPARERDRFDLAGVLTAAAGHFTHDLYPSFIGPLLPLLIEKHGLSLAAAGALATVPRWPGLAMPFMGYIADRYDARAFVIWGPTVTALAMSSLGMAPNYVAMVALLLVAGFSSAAFHPGASAAATQASGRQWGRGASFFLTGGELSRVVGPPFIVAVVSLFTLQGAWIAALPALAMSLLSSRKLGRGVSGERQPSSAGLLAAVKARKGALLVLVGVVSFRALVIASFQTFYATYLTSVGETLVYAGIALAVYEAGGTVGAFLGGPASDRFGRRTTMALSQVASGPLLFVALIWGGSPIGLAALFCGGLLALSAGPAQLALAQELLPSNRSAASGIMMFLSFEGTVFATLTIGLVADTVGLQTTLAASVLASMLSLPFTFMLPETRGEGLRAGH